MDNLRVFNTFKSRNLSEFKAPSTRILNQHSEEASRPIMRTRSLDDKPSMSRSEILQRLEKKDQGQAYSTKVSGKRFGDNFLKSKEEIKAAKEEVVLGKKEVVAGKEDLKANKEEPVAAKEKPVVPKEELQAGNKGEEVIGDVQKNDPKDPMTTEKLKSILNSGAINFSDKMKKVLGNILSP